jgi:Zn ribbon nucleic-acid-binding protein
MEHFFNEGFGWTCRRCHAETKARESHTDSRARFFTEGEAGDCASQLSAPALARWRDDSRQTLVCPRCGIEEYLKDVNLGNE